MADLFVYGTLMDPDIMGAVAGRCRRLAAATLPGHRRLAVRDAPYPGIVPAPAHNVEGVVYTAIGPRGLVRLDRFEGEMYKRVRVRVTLANGSRRTTFTYVIKRAFRDRLEPRAWDPEAFLAHDKAAFQKRYTGFKRT
ncbi:MAG: gamma-glutamylcyclotransferase family protein [Gammaproteobacteria bacterium]|nr:gamma-glutamylcyclotransferase family protein [Gammaproteobacteria bacterium]